MANKIVLYGLSDSRSGTSESQQRLAIEFQSIKLGGRFKVKGFGEQGMGLPYHYAQACKLLWPHIDQHRWFNLCNQEIRRPNAKITVLMGPGSCGKTNQAAWQYLVDYYCRPKDTLVLISSTDLRGLELRVWGEIKKLHEKATESFPELPGYLIDSKHCITTDELDEERVEDFIKTRDLRSGVIAIPTVQGGRAVGLGRWSGIKQNYLKVVADDCQSMSSVFLTAFSNLNNNSNFEALILGNPDDVLDPLGIAAEPKDGWSSHLEPQKTCVWDTKFYNGRCVNLVGTDSPNFDYPGETRFPYLVSQKKIDETVSGFGKDSFEYYSQCVGVMRISQMSRRVITRDLCQQFNAADDCVWDAGSRIQKVCALDAAYGGDRAKLGFIEYGRCIDGVIRVRCNPQVIVPIRFKTDSPMDAETQIARYVRSYCEDNGISPEDFFHDSTGRGALGTALAREWSSACNPVEFGGNATKRPVSSDIFTTDPATGNKRAKRCDEHYFKFVTELWFSVRYLIEADQMRKLEDEVRDEFCARIWERVKDDKISLESKIDMKKRVGFSPDSADCLTIAVEGARRKGLIIAKLGIGPKQGDYKWLDQMAKDRRELRHSKQLTA